ncbi:MAG: RNA polymerase sporulation sigma factor SigE [Clostridia bacterium]|nr:RNA polymerase sporulation sigma factor SigE [Clostridia bacterium]
MFSKSNFLSKLLLLILGRNNEVHYIGGPEVLPAPLTQEEEAELISEMGVSEEKDTEIKNILIERNLRLVVYIAKRFENTKIGIEDLISIGTIGLMKAIGTFKPDKNIKLATYASRCIENEILMFIRKTSSQKAEVSLDEPLNVDWDGNELLLSDILGTDKDEVHRGIEAEEERKCIYNAVRKLSDRDRQIICMRFGFFTGESEMTQKEVADTLGISQSYISRLEKKIISNLKSEMAEFYK